ncbi:hypothetical protein FRC06_000397 [Ceratobasidium sp. 370]|nr:hypothetical protein FRC06_000397 [Ceratobasidium sp. 370]
MDSDQDLYLSSQSKEIDCVPDLLQPNSPLQRLSVGMYFIDKYLPFISQMSRVQSLVLTWSDWEIATTRSKLPLNSFPALRALTFNEVELLQVGSTWEQVPELFTNLTKLECTFGITDYYGERYEPITSFPLRFTTALGTKCPNVTDLTIHFNHGDYYVEHKLIYFDKSTLQILAKLPLQRLSVEAATIIEPGYTDTKTCRLLASTFPNLEVLRWTHQLATRQGLRAFADMPNLRHLGFYAIEREIPAKWSTRYLENTLLAFGRRFKSFPFRYRIQSYQKTKRTA